MQRNVRAGPLASFVTLLHYVSLEAEFLFKSRTHICWRRWSRHVASKLPHLHATQCWSYRHTQPRWALRWYWGFKLRFLGLHSQRQPQPHPDSTTTVSHIMSQSVLELSMEQCILVAIPLPWPVNVEEPRCLA